MRSSKVKLIVVIKGSQEA